MSELKIVPCGDMAVSIEFKNEISEEVHGKVAATAAAIEAAAPEAMTEMIPTYRTLMVCYDPLICGYSQFKKELEEILKRETVGQKIEETIVEIPVLYGGEYGPDLAMVAKHNGITEEEVISIHSGPKYLIYMLGFTPGFPYLGGMDKRIATPRLESPRVRIPGGSVGIAGEQTGIYPMDSPGGWQIIGRTPLKLYDPDRENPILLKASQKIVFKPITEAEYEAIVRGDASASLEQQGTLGREVQ